MLGARDQREALGVVDGFQRKIDVEGRPVQVIEAGTLNIENLGHRSLPEPREVLK